MNLRPLITGLILLLLILRVDSALAAGEVHAVVDLGVGGSRSEVDGGSVQSQKSNYEKFSLSYNVKGVLGDRRAGHYSLMIGYDFSRIAPTIIKDGERDRSYGAIQAGKVLYRGGLVLAPGGLPFRLTASIFDTAPPSAVSRRLDNSVLQDTYSSGGDVKNDMSSGTHQEIAVTLLLGIRNGSYLGAYRDYLSQVPRLMVDYKQVEVHDTASNFSLVHYVARDVAFVSLNKKDNWIHYRTHEFTDYLDRSNDRTSTQVMIGTVDHMMSRQWINLTNWIRISGDISYTEERAAHEAHPQKTYQLNLFTSTRRQGYRLDVPSTWSRVVKEGDHLSQDASLPIYFSAELNRDNSLSLTLVNNFSRETSLNEGVLNGDKLDGRSHMTSLSMRGDLFRTRPLYFRPNLSLSMTNEGETSSFGETLGLEWGNRTSKNAFFWTLSLGLAADQRDEETTSSRYLEENLALSLRKGLSRNLVASMTVSARHGDGNSEDAQARSNPNSETLVDPNLIDNGLDSRFSTYGLSTYLDHDGVRFDNRLGFVLESSQTPDDSTKTMQVQHILQQRSRENGSLTVTSELNFGDFVTARGGYFDFVSPAANGESVDLSWMSEALYKYSPSRSFNLSLTGSLSGTGGGEGGGESWRLAEKVDYRFFTVNGIVRKLAEITEEIGLEQVPQSNESRNSALYVRFEGSIYPTKYLYAKFRSEWVTLGPSGSTQMSYDSETGLNFALLQVALSYGRGYKTREDSMAAAEEEHWDLKIRKTF